MLPLRGQFKSAPSTFINEDRPQVTCKSETETQTSPTSATVLRIQAMSGVRGEKHSVGIHIVIPCMLRMIAICLLPPQL